MRASAQRTVALAAGLLPRITNGCPGHVGTVAFKAVGAVAGRGSGTLAGIVICEGAAAVMPGLGTQDLKKFSRSVLNSSL